MSLSRELRCAQGHLVGLVLGPPYAGVVAIRHKGQEVIAYAVVCIKCDCGAVWRAEAPQSVLADMETKSVPAIGG